MGYFIFLLIGIIILLLSGILHLFEYTLLSNLFLNLGVTFVAVTLIQYIWKKNGGDPLIEQVNKLKSSISLLNDLEGTGLIRYYRQRKEVDFNEWLERMETASQVDIFGVVLQANWAENTNFIDIVERRAGLNQCKFRIIISEPGSQILEQRAIEQGDEIGRLNTDANDSLRVLLGIRNKLPDEYKDNLQIKVNGRRNIYVGIIRVDDKMLVTTYLSWLRGNETPSFEIDKVTGSKALFSLYERDFEDIYRITVDWQRQTPALPASQDVPNIPELDNADLQKVKR